jgi:hypothetical protein
MSTHIIKPEPISDAVVPDLVESEEWAMRLAKAAGFKVANVELHDFDGRKAIVVERYDRVVVDASARKISRRPLELRRTTRMSQAEQIPLGFFESRTK